MKCTKQNHITDMCRTEVNCEICASKGQIEVKCPRRNPVPGYLGNFSAKHVITDLERRKNRQFKKMV